MTQADLNREVAQATGESVREIARRGFIPLTPFPIEREPLVVDWDKIEARRRIPVCAQRSRDRAA